MEFFYFYKNCRLKVTVTSKQHVNTNIIPQYYSIKLPPLGVIPITCPHMCESLLKIIARSPHLQSRLNYPVVLGRVEVVLQGDRETSVVDAIECKVIPRWH